jgi:hypothetical protein
MGATKMKERKKKKCPPVLSGLGSVVRNNPLEPTCSEIKTGIHMYRGENRNRTEEDCGKNQMNE